jgi:hypothetical protein
MGLAAIWLTTIFLAALERAFSAAADVFLACAARLFAGSLEQRRAPSLIPQTIWKLAITGKKKEGAAEAGPYISVKSEGAGRVKENYRGVFYSMMIPA